jgi:DSF synthase
MNARVEFSLASLFSKEYQQVEIEFDPDHSVAWTYMKPSGTPCFNVALLKELRAHDEAVEACRGMLLDGGELRQIHYYVVASKIDGIFNLGGDLALFAQLVKLQDRDALMRYAKLCVENMYARICNYNAPMTTISLVQGEALGGGFETVLSSNIIIAERRSRMGLPEILFNLFPGMGAYSLLARRVGVKRAEEIVLSGRIYSAEELLEIGIVDVLAEDGAGHQAVRDFIRANEKRRNGMQAVFQCRQEVAPISHEQLMNITNIWVDAALRLQERDLKIMTRIARAQVRRTDRGAGGAHTQLISQVG